jgi:hypothetical protein
MGVPFIAMKGAGALMTNARAKQAIKIYMDLGTFGQFSKDIERNRRRQGGIWVGGKLSLYDDHVQFDANALNRALAVDIEDIKIPFTDVLSIQSAWGFVTGKIVVTHAYGENTFRCYGSKALTETMNVALQNWRLEHSE